MRTYKLFDAPPDAPATPPAPETDAAAILDGLNPVQREAARTTEGPVMIVAGPGSGKTRTLTHRIAYLMAAKQAWPSQILALTFTNKAAREMRERVLRLVGEEGAKGIWMGTFHSVFARILRREAEKIGYTRDFSIYDPTDSENIIKAQMLRYGIDAKRYTPRSVRHRISGAKNQLVSPQEYQRLAADPFEEAAAKVYGPYNDALRRANALDFDDLLIKPIELFQRHPDVLAEYQKRWKYLHIDEYQDTNHAQYILAKMLAAAHKNLCVVGDDAQSIYAFRGADIQNILSFQKDYPDATTIRLEQNYRSTQQHPPPRRLHHQAERGPARQGPLDRQRRGRPRRPDGGALREATRRRRWSARIRDLHVRHGVGYRQVAVLYRTNAQSRSIEDALRRGGIPYRIVGGLSFYQRKEIKDALAYLRLVVNPNDEASPPPRHQHAHARDRREDRSSGLGEFAARARAHAVAGARAGRGRGLSAARAASAVEDFAFLVGRFAAKANTGAGRRARARTHPESGLLSNLRDENTREALARWENVHELLNAVAEFTGAHGSAEHAPRSPSSSRKSRSSPTPTADEGDENRVTLMTLHALEGAGVQGRLRDGAGGGALPARDGGAGPEGVGGGAAAVLRRRDARRGAALPLVRPQPLPLRRAAVDLRSRFLDEVDAEDVIRTETGRAFTGKQDRFSVGRGGTGSFEDMDPHYYRQNLRDAPQRTQRPRPAPEPDRRPADRLRRGRGRDRPRRPRPPPDRSARAKCSPSKAAATARRRRCSSKPSGRRSSS